MMGVVIGVREIVHDWFNLFSTLTHYSGDLSGCCGKQFGHKVRPDLDPNLFDTLVVTTPEFFFVKVDLNLKICRQKRIKCKITQHAC